MRVASRFAVEFTGSTPTVHPPIPDPPYRSSSMRRGESGVGCMRGAMISLRGMSFSLLASRTSDERPTAVMARTAIPEQRGSWRRYRLVIALLDGAAMVLAANIAAAVRFAGYGPGSAPAASVPYDQVGLLLAVVWLGILGVGGAYDRRHLGSGSEEYRRVLSSAARLLSIVAILAFVLDLNIARVYVALTIPLGAALTLVDRYLVRRWLHHQRARGRFLRQTLVIGAESSIRDMIGLVNRLPHAGLSIWAAWVPAHDGKDLVVDGQTVVVFGGARDPVELVKSCGADAVLIADRASMEVDALRQLAWDLEATQVSLLVAPEVVDVAGPLTAIRPMSGLPVLTVEEPELGGVRRILKETFDRAFAAVCLLLLAPGLVLVGIAIRLTSPGPAIFKQVRVGLRGRRFVLWKFRTMTVDAEERRATLLDLNEHDGILFKIRDDPRVTGLGRVLRRWSIDEIPQLWNVVRGEMSIVGPRPPLPAEVENYCHRVRRRLLVKPGMTGLWQISGRAGLPWEESVRLDLHYVENWSPSLDMAILAKTMSAVVRGHGAY